MPRSRITTQFAFEDHNASILQRVNRGVADFKNLVFSPAGAIAGAGALAAGIAKITSNYLQNADALQKMSLRTGLSTKELGALKFAFEQADLSSSDLQRTVARLNDQGLTLDDFADRIANIDDISERTSLAVDVLGQRLGPRLLSLLDQGSEGLDRYRQQHERLGLSIDQESAEAAARFNDNIDTINRVVEGAGNRIGQAIVNWSGPILQGIGESLGILPTEARTQAQRTEEAFTSRLTEALLAGETLGVALTDPVIQRLQRMARDAGVNVRLAIRAVTDELRNEELGNALRGFEGALYSGYSPQYAAELSAANFEDISVNDILTASAVRNPAFNAGGQTGISPGQAALQRYLQRQGARPDLSAINLQYSNTAWSAGPSAGIIGPYNPFYSGAFNPDLLASGIPADIPLDAEYAGRGFGGPVQIDGQGLIDASKNDPVRVTVAGVGGLNEGAGRNQRFREIRVDENDLINREGLINLVLAVLEDYVG